MYCTRGEHRRSFSVEQVVAQHLADLRAAAAEIVAALA
jgi:hypothetical protein